MAYNELCSHQVLIVRRGGAVVHGAQDWLYTC